MPRRADFTPNSCAQRRHSEGASPKGYALTTHLGARGISRPVDLSPKPHHEIACIVVCLGFRREMPRALVFSMMVGEGHAPMLRVATAVGPTCDTLGFAALPLGSRSSAAR